MGQRTFAEFFIKEAKKGFYPYPGNGSNFIPWVHIDDLAAAYVLAAAILLLEQVLHVVDDEPMRLKDFGLFLVAEAGGGRSMGMPKWLVSILAGAPLVEMLTGSYRARNEKVKRLLGWEPAIPGSERWAFLGDCSLRTSKRARESRHGEARP